MSDIASWHPGVALAVSDWLEEAALWGEECGTADEFATAVARTYLGEDR